MPEIKDGCVKPARGVIMPAAALAAFFAPLWPRARRGMARRASRTRAVEPNAAKGLDVENRR